MIRLMKVDGRKLSHAKLEEIRFAAVKAVQAGQSPSAVAGDGAFIATASSYGLRLIDRVAGMHCVRVKQAGDRSGLRARS